MGRFTVEDGDVEGYNIFSQLVGLYYTGMLLCFLLTRRSRFCSQNRLRLCCSNKYEIGVQHNTLFLSDRQQSIWHSSFLIFLLLLLIPTLLSPEVNVSEEFISHSPTIFFHNILCLSHIFRV